MKDCKNIVVLIYLFSSLQIQIDTQRIPSGKNQNRYVVVNKSNIIVFIENKMYAYLSFSAYIILM